MSLMGKVFKTQNTGYVSPELLSFLQNISFLRQLDRYELKLFARLLNSRLFKAGEYIFHENYPIAVMYIVADGEVDIILENDPQEAIILSTYYKFGHFGEMGLFIETNRTASARAKTDSVLYAVSKKDFEHFIQISPKIGVKILFELAVQLSNMVVQTNEKLKEK